MSTPEQRDSAMGWDCDTSERGPFSEKGFYLEEFRGRTLGILLPDSAAAAHPGLIAVLDELRANHTRAVLVAPATVELGQLECEVLPASTDRLEGRVWRGLRSRGRVAVRSTGKPFATLLEVAKRLTLYKVIRLGEAAGVRDGDGRRQAFVDLGELEQLLGDPTRDHVELLREVRALLAAGVPNVNLCTIEGLYDELFSYSGSGTLFTRERYVVVRHLGVDDYDAAHDLVARGVAEGYLLARPSEAVDLLLADGFGAFVEGRHLAGIGALQVVPGSAAAEVASLYTLTRFVREGVGTHLVSFALATARELGLDYVFACTTSTRAGEFFARLGFSAVSPDLLPAAKWQSYDPARRRRLLCYRRDV